MVRTSDDAAGRILNAIEYISGLTEAQPGRLAPRREVAPGPNSDLVWKPRIPEPIRAPEPIKRAFQARLNYDLLDAEVFLEILDPETGKVLRRFPAEKASEDEIASHGGTILNRLA